MDIRNIEEAEAALLPYVPLVAELTGKDLTVQRIRPLMKLLGNPQDQIKMVHIAGTNGKTSTAYYIAALLAAAGRQVGLMISPHVDSVRERVQINGHPLPEAEFCDKLAAFLDIVNKVPDKISYYELLYAFGFWVLTDAGVEYAVIETGLGGLHDTTNIAARPDKICVITDIGFDHMSILGKTLPEITLQKVGIVHAHNPVFVYQQDESVMGVIRDWTTKHNSPLTVTTEAAERTLYTGHLPPGMPAYQQRNWLLAYRVFRFIAEQDGLTLNDDKLASTQTTKIPGRMEVRPFRHKLLIMDGAHNAQKMATFIDSFLNLYPGSPPAILLALKEGKEHQELVPLVAKVCARVIVSTFETSQDLPAKSQDPYKLAAALEQAGAPNIQVIPDQHEAFEALLNSPEEICIITGSLYLLNQLRRREGLDKPNG